MSGGDREIIGPSSHFFVSQRIRLHYVDWGNAEAPPLVLLHGSRDHARSWDWVARELRREYHVIAPDHRGHGDSAWALGGGYTNQDFVLDLAQLLEVVGRFPVILVGHSLGGGVALHYAGTFPDHVAKLVSAEGLGLPPEMHEKLEAEPAAERLRGWIERGRGLADRQPRRYATIDAAADRMVQENSFLSAGQAHHLTMHGVARNEDGTYSWKFDNYVRAFDPLRFTREEARQLWSEIRCPVLLVRGSQGWGGDPEAGGRLEAFRDARSVCIDGAGHWVHHDRFDEFMAATWKFLRE